MATVIGHLRTMPALERRGLLAEPVVAALAARPDVAERVQVAEIDPGLADTAEFCKAYAVPLEASANCVVVSGRRGGDARTAACVVLATTRADVNGVVRRMLDVRKASFLPMEEATQATGMEYGGITPLGVPAGWRLLVDAAVAVTPYVVVGSGLRRSKLVLPGATLALLPEAAVVDGLGR